MSRRAVRTAWLIAMGLVVVVAPVAPGHAQVWTENWAFPDEVLSPYLHMAIMTGEADFEAIQHSTAITLGLVPYLPAHAQAAWRRAKRERITVDEALSEQLAENHPGADAAALEAELLPELQRFAELESQFESLEAVHLTQTMGRQQVSEDYEARFAPAGGSGETPLQVYDRQFQHYNDRGYTEHYAAVSAITDARQRLVRFTEPHRDPEQPGEVAYNEILFYLDYALREDVLFVDLSPGDRRRTQQDNRSLIGTYGFAYPWTRLDAIRFLAEADGPESLYAAGIYLNAAALQRSAEGRDDPEALSRLALFYQEGLGVGKDRDEAERLLQRAVELGSVEAADELATLYYTELESFVGDTWDRDRALVPRYYAQAADGGSAKGMFNLGGMYYRGYGVQRDLSAAQQWFDRATVASPSEWFGQVSSAWSARAAEEAAEQTAAQQRAQRWDNLQALDDYPMAQALYALGTDARVATAVVSFAGLLSALQPAPQCDEIWRLTVCDVSPSNRDPYVTNLEWGCGAGWRAEAVCAGNGYCDQKTGDMFTRRQDAVDSICGEAAGSPGVPQLGVLIWR